MNGNAEDLQQGTTGYTLEREEWDQAFPENLKTTENNNNNKSLLSSDTKKKWTDEAKISLTGHGGDRVMS